MTFSSPHTSSDTSSPNAINVMLVDDSSVIRGALRRIIENDPAINVIGSVPNGELAITSAKKDQPDIVILDIEMPVMDGLTALPKILEVSPNSKVIMFSTLTEKGASVTLKAFSLGAVECLVKPSGTQAVGEGSEFQTQILTLIKGLAPEEARTSNKEQPSASALAQTTTSSSIQLRPVDPHAKKPSLVAIGSSTGGPQALFDVIKNFKDFDVPILVTQHMPATFTKILAEHIEQQSGIPAFEGAEGMRVESGKVYVAPGGYHMLLDMSSGSLKIKLDDGPEENFCKPAVDPMYRSAVELFGSQVLGVILTGMGQDGLEGGRALVEKGGRLIAQDEKSSTVWGMPGAVATAGLCCEVLPLDEIGPWIRKAVLG